MNDGLSGVWCRGLGITLRHAGIVLALTVLVAWPTAQAFTNLPPSSIRQVWGGGHHAQGALAVDRALKTFPHFKSPR